MSSLLRVVLASLVPLFQILGSNAVADRKTCPKGEFAQASTDNTLTLITGNVYKYDETWLQPTSSRLPVLVKACKDAHFKLQPSDDSVVYEIVLGSNYNMLTEIRVPGKTGNESITGGVLRCDEFVPFVIAWNTNKIVVAKGTNDSAETVVEWGIPSSNMDVKLVNLSGYTLSKKVPHQYFEEYQFKESEVSSVGVKTPAPSAYKRFRRTLHGQDGIRFKLKASGEATLAFLASDDKDFNRATYKLTIGAQNNTQTILYYMNNQSILSNSTPGLLSNLELRQFWIAWKDGGFGFGLGIEFYKNSKLVSPEAPAVGNIHSMAVDSTQQAEWEFAPSDHQGFSCVATCQVGWYPDKTTGNCRQCSVQLSNCFSCNQSQLSERPVCTACTNETVMLGEGGDCVAECPPRLGYTPDYDRRECACAFGSCCGPVFFRLCFMVLPCLLGILLLVPVLPVAIRKLRRLKIIDPDNIDFDQLSNILKLIPPHVVENLYTENMRNQQTLLMLDQMDVPVARSMAREADETSFNCGVNSAEGNMDDPYVNTLQSKKAALQNRGPLPRAPISN